VRRCFGPAQQRHGGHRAGLDRAHRSAVPQARRRRGRREATLSGRDYPARRLRPGGLRVGRAPLDRTEGGRCCGHRRDARARRGHGRLHGHQARRLRIPGRPRRNPARRFQRHQTMRVLHRARTAQRLHSRAAALSLGIEIARVRRHEKKDHRPAARGELRTHAARPLLSRRSLLQSEPLDRKDRRTRVAAAAPQAVAGAAQWRAAPGHVLECDLCDRTRRSPDHSATGRADDQGGIRGVDRRSA
jgi:hypothetical protein